MRETLRETIRIARARHALRALLVAVGVSAVFLLASGFLLARQTTDTCGAALSVRDAMVAVLVDAQLRTEQVPAETQREQQRQQALEFYERAIARLRAVDCTQ